MQLVKLLFSMSRARVVMVFVAGLVSGVANTYLLFLISHALAPQTHTSVVRFAVTGMIAVVGGVISQMLLIRLNEDAIYQLRSG